MAKDSARSSTAGKHNPKNVGTTPMSALLVEFKGAKPGTATIPTNRPGMQSKQLADGPYGNAYIVTASPDFHEAAGTKHDYDQVVISAGSIDDLIGDRRQAREDDVEAR